MEETKTAEGEVLSNDSAETILNVPEELTNLKVRVAMLLESNLEFKRNLDYTQGKTRFHDENIAEITGNIHALGKDIEKANMTRERDVTNQSRDTRAMNDEIKQIQKVCRTVREHESTKADATDLNRVENAMQR